MNDIIGADPGGQRAENTEEPVSSGGSVLLIAFVIFLSALAGLAGWLLVTDSTEDTLPSYSNSAALTSPIVVEKKTPAQPVPQPPATSPPPSEAAAVTPKIPTETPSHEATHSTEAANEVTTTVEATADIPPEAEAKTTVEVKAETKAEEPAKPATPSPVKPAPAQISHEATSPGQKEKDEPATPPDTGKAAAILAVRPAPSQELSAGSHVKPAQRPAPEAAAETGAKQPETKPKTEVKPKPDAVAAVKQPQPEPDPPPVKAAVETQQSMTFSLPQAPDPALVTKGNYGLLPVIGPTGQLPWRVYARPFTDPLERPQIALIISDMGMSEAATRSVIRRLSGAVTMSFNPYAKGLQNWIEQSRAAGHEVILQLPMEPYGYPENDPGPHTLLTSLSARENLNRLEWLLSRFTGYTGVTSQMGSKFISSDKDIEPVLTVIKKSGLLFVDTRSSSKSVSARIAKKMGLPVAINNRYLDNSASRNAIDARLSELERIARVTGQAVGIGYPYPVTIERIVAWSESLARKGLVLVPVSEIVNKQELQ